MKNVLFLMMALTLVSAPALMCEPIKTDAPAYQSKGTVMVPMRAIFEWLGAEVSFDSATGGITAKRGEQVVSLKAGSKTATVNGETKTMSTSAESRNGRTFVPVRFVAEAFGAEVKWYSASKTATVVQGTRVGTLKVPSEVLSLNPDKPKVAKYSTSVSPLESSTEAVGKLSWKTKGRGLNTPVFSTVADGWQVRVRTTNVKPGPGKMTILIFEICDDVYQNGFWTKVLIEAGDALLGDKTPKVSELYVREGTDKELAMAMANQLPGVKDSITREVSALEMFEHTSIARRGVETKRGDITYWGVGSFFPAGEYRITLLFKDSDTGDIDVTLLP